MQPTYEIQEALDQATVVIDCTPDGVANQHKIDWFQHMPTTTGFLAQGSETGFGKPYACGINDGALVPDEDRFIQIVSCNFEHNPRVSLRHIHAWRASTFLCCHGRQCPPRPLCQATGFVSSRSMLSTSCTDSGATCDRKRATTVP